jgi:hypothetical protein
MPGTGVPGAFILLFWVALVSGLSLGGPARGATIEIRDIHVTQGIQTVRWEPGNDRGFAAQAGNALPLVAGRSTAVRVLLGLTFAPGEPREPTPAIVLGTLEVFVATRPVGVFAADNEPFSIPVEPKIDLSFHTLNFTIPEGVLRFPGPGWSRSVAEFRVTIGAGRRGGLVEYVTEGRADSPDERFEGLLLLAHPRLTVLAETVQYPPFAQNPDVRLDLIGPGRGDAYLLAALPIDDSCAPGPSDCPYRLLGGFSYAMDANGNGTIDADIDPSPDVIDTTELRDLLSVLAARRNLLVDDGDPANRWTFLYGWLPSASTTGAYGFTGAGKVAAGMDWPADGQQTLAHEIGHQFGLEHVPDRYCNYRPVASIAPNVGWDVLDRLAFNPADQDTPEGWPGNGVSGRIKLPEMKNLMNACFPLGMTTAERWTSTVNYSVISARLRDADSTWQPGDDDLAMDPACQRAVTIAGEVTAFSRASGRGRAMLIPEKARLFPAFDLPPCRYPTPAYRATDLYAEIVASNAGRTEKVRVPLDAHMIVDMDERIFRAGDGESVEPDGQRPGDQAVAAASLGPFTASIPIEGVVVSIALVNRDGTSVLARMERSRAAPEVEIIAPKPGATLGTKTTLRWQVADPDSPGSAMMYHVAYSPDGGRSFYPVDVNLRATSVTFDATNLPGSEAGQGLLRVFVSDGLNSGFTDLSRLSNPASRSTVPSRGR